MAKASLSEIYSRTARRSVEIHGGIGFTWDFDLHLWFKRAHLGEVLFGDPAFHRERIATLDGY
jgi:alkylation response protein AidB-like acyl-CoA dehydrogenase